MENDGKYGIIISVLSKHLCHIVYFVYIQTDRNQSGSRSSKRSAYLITIFNKGRILFYEKNADHPAGGSDRRKPACILWF